jgi:outer membrane protein assembly factor BamB
VFNTESCTIFAVKIATGELVWSHWLGDPLMSAPAIAHKMVFSAYPAEAKAGSSATKPPGATHALAAFDLKSGELLWTRWIDADVMSSPVAVADALYATSFAGTVYKFDQRTGDVLAARKARATSAPTIVNSDVFYTKRNDAPGAPQAQEAIARAATKPAQSYTGSSKRADYLDHAQQSQTHFHTSGTMLDASNGFGGGAPSSANAGAALSLVGQGSVSTLQAFQGSRILNLAHVNLNVMGDELICTATENGAGRWKWKVPGDLREGGSLATTPIAAKTSVFVGTLAGEVVRLSAETGRVEQRYPIGAPIRAQPILEDGWLYVVTENGKLVAVNTGEPTLTGWTTWGADAARTGRPRPARR